jgi:tetratricopeptide (TPR) repeat protein
VTERLDPALLDSLWDFSDPAASAERLADAAAHATPSAAAELRTQHARALGLAGDRAGADAVLDAITDQVTDPSPVLAIRVALERGRLVNSAGSRPEAVPFFTEALELARAASEDFLAIDAAHMLAIADEERSGEWTAQGIHIVDATTDPRAQRWGIALHNNLAWTHHDAGLFEEALAEFEAADAAARAHGSTEQQEIAQWSIARCLRSLGRRAEALAIQERLLELRPDDEYVHEELAALRE